MEPRAKDCCLRSMKEFNEKYSNLAKAKETAPPIRFFDDNTVSIRKNLDEGLMGRRHNFTPKCVAIGPRFRGEDGLKDGEELKHAAAHDFWRGSDMPFSALYARVEKVAAEARNSYPISINSGIAEEEFTAMLFIDGCFLIQLIAYSTDDATTTTSEGFAYHANNLVDSLLVDIFIVENQIPWIVLKALMSARPVQVMRFIDMLVASLDKQGARPGHAWGESADDYKPIHLLDLLYKQQVGEASRSLTLGDLSKYRQPVISLTSASELEEAGVQIRPSPTPRFADVHFQRRWLVFRRLLLPPLLLDANTVPIIFNMMAFELLHKQELLGRSHMGVCIAMLSRLISTEEDVRQLRRKGLIITTLSDKDVMELIKKMEPHIQGASVFTIYPLLLRITTFFKTHRLWITLHRLVYNNLKFLLAIGSFLSVSISILKAILSLRDSPMAATGTAH
ncbi:unnamed protein product [Urochloa humidicola]